MRPYIIGFYSYGILGDIKRKILKDVKIFGGFNFFVIPLQCTS
jgi:hypothetical protein